MLFSEVARVSRAVAGTTKRNEKKALLAAFLGRGWGESGETAVASGDLDERVLAALYLAGETRQRRLNVGYAQVRAAWDAAAQAEGPALLTLRDVDEALGRVAEAQGSGSGEARLRDLTALLARATEDERTFLMALILGELRQGALVKLLLEALAEAADVPIAAVRQAQMTAGDLGAVVRAAFAGASALAELALRLFVPVQSMLAATCASVDEAVELLGEAAWEWKLDGARIQVHKREQEIRVFSRALNDVTAAVPEVVAWARALPARELILDGEALALDGQGRPHSFQTTMRRFGRKVNVGELQGTLPLSPFAFDLLWWDGESWLHRPGRERAEALRGLVGPEARVERLETADRDEAQRFYEHALASGHEGVMAKSLVAPYRAGLRDVAWLKLKRVHTLDLVVLAAEWGSGRRRGFLSNLHLGCRGPGGTFVMLGKTFKGLTDELLAWQTTALLARKSHEDGPVVFVRPELVVEIAFNDVQVSRQYPGGVALRFARVRGYRPDKRPDEADTLETVRRFLPTSTVEGPQTSFSF